MKTKKVWSAVLSFALVISSIMGFGSGNARAAEEAKKLIVYVAAQGTSEDGKTTVDLQKTAVQVKEGAKASDAIRQALDASAYKGNYVITENNWGMSLDAIGDVAQTEDWSYYWSFCVNNTLSSVGISAYELQDQDKISLIYGTYSETAKNQCDCYADDSAKNPSDEAQTALLETATEQQAVLAETIYKEQFAGGKNVPGIENAEGLYSVFSLARAGFAADSFYDAVYAKVEAQLAQLQSGGKVYDAVTDSCITWDSILANKAPAQYYAKIALCMAALGKNPEDIGGVNLIEKLADRKVYEASSIYSRESMILFAIDAMNSVLPEGEAYLTRAELVNKAASDVDSQITTALEWNSLDSAAMAIQALAPYTLREEKDVDGQAVKTACGKVFELLTTMQRADGAYGDSYSASNVWTLAQIMITIGAFGINPMSEAEGYDFIKNGNTVFDAASAFVHVENKTVDSALMGFQPEQLLRGLNACIRSCRSQKSIFDTTSVEYTAKESTATVLSEDMIGRISNQTYTGKAVKPAVTVKDKGVVLKEGVDYTVAYQNNTKVGTAYAVVTGIGNYILSQKVAFSIVEKKITLKKPVIKNVTSNKKKNLTVTFQKVSNAKKYVVEISANKNFKKVTKKTVKTTKATFTKLSSGKKYYVRVRAYNGKTASAYSKAVGRKVK